MLSEWRHYLSGHENSQVLPQFMRLRCAAIFAGNVPCRNIALRLPLLRAITRRRAAAPRRARFSAPRAHPPAAPLPRAALALRAPLAGRFFCLTTLTNLALAAGRRWLLLRLRAEPLMDACAHSPRVAGCAGTACPYARLSAWMSGRGDIASSLPRSRAFPVCYLYCRSAWRGAQTNKLGVLAWREKTGLFAVGADGRGRRNMAKTTGGACQAALCLLRACAPLSALATYASITAHRVARSSRVRHCIWRPRAFCILANVLAFFNAGDAVKEQSGLHRTALGVTSAVRMACWAYRAGSACRRHDGEYGRSMLQPLCLLHLFVVCASRWCLSCRAVLRCWSTVPRLLSLFGLIISVLVSSL